VNLEARNLAPDVAELQGGTPVRAVSAGGADNVASFELVGKQRGSFVISIRLVVPPQCSALLSCCLQCAELLEGIRGCLSFPTSLSISKRSSSVCLVMFSSAVRIAGSVSAAHGGASD